MAAVADRMATAVDDILRKTYMRKRKWFAMIALAAATVCGTSAAAALSLIDAAALESRIDAVTVFPRGAEVTRVARVALQPGSNHVVLDGFPGDIDLARVRAEAAGGDAEVGSIRLEVRQRRDAFDNEVRRLQQAITAVGDEIAAINDEIAAAELQLKFLEGLAQDYSAGERRQTLSGQADIPSWSEALESLGKGASDTMRRIRESKTKLREAENERSALERELAGKRKRREDSARLMVSLTSRAESAQETELRVTYFRRAAQWRSGYAAFIDTGNSEVRLVHEGRITQTTGESWTNVALTLSTSDPGGRMAAPDQGSRFLDIYDSRERALMAGQGFAASAESATFEMAERKGVGDARNRKQPRGDSNRFAVLYRSPERVDIANDAEDEQELPLAEYRYDAALVSRVTPRQDPAAFVVARITHNSDTPLFGGQMRLFRNGSFAGVTRLPTLLPGAEVTLPMGTDRQLDVMAVDQGGEKGSEGLISARNTELVDFLFEIVNRHSLPVEVEAVDYYPVPRDERIEVSVPRGASAPDEEDFMDRPGVIVWRKELAPGERWRIVHQYEVSYPRDTVLASAD